MKKLRHYTDLFWVFFQIGAVTFGGGLAMLPMLERELVHRRRWLTSERLVDYYAIGQSTPGIIAVNVATFVGHSRHGIPGAIVATIGIILPSILVICAVAGLLGAFAGVPAVQKALRGINVVVAVLLIFAVSRVGKRTIADWITGAIALAAFISIVIWDVPAFFVVVFSAILGILIRLRREREKDGAA